MNTTTTIYEDYPNITNDLNTEIDLACDKEINIGYQLKLNTFTGFCDGPNDPVTYYTDIKQASIPPIDVENVIGEVLLDYVSPVYEYDDDGNLVGPTSIQFTLKYTGTLVQHDGSTTYAELNGVRYECEPYNEAYIVMNLNDTTKGTVHFFYPVWVNDSIGEITLECNTTYEIQ